MKALTSAQSLVVLGFVLLGESPAEAKRPRPRRAPAPSAVVRHAAPAPVAPASVPAAPSAGISVAPASPGARPAALDVAAGCVPVWIVEGRETRRLPDRCPQPRATAPTLLATQDARRTEAALSAGNVALAGADGGVPERTLTRPVIAASGTSAPTERAASRRRAAKKKLAAE